MNAETKCKNCGNSLGLHRSDSACPIDSYFDCAYFDCDELAPLPLNPEGDWPKKFQAREGLRKILFSRWLQSAKDKNQWRINNPGKDLPNKESDIPGYFHQFGNHYEEFEAGPGNYSTAIVETEDGQVFEVFPSDVKFIS